MVKRVMDGELCEAPLNSHSEALSNHPQSVAWKTASVRKCACDVKGWGHATPFPVALRVEGGPVLTEGLRGEQGGRRLASRLREGRQL